LTPLFDPRLQQDHRAWTLSANVHMVKKQWKQAQDIFQKLLDQQRTGRSKTQMDSYSMLSLANIYFASNRMNHAKDFYLRVLPLSTMYCQHCLIVSNRCCVTTTTTSMLPTAWLAPSPMSTSTMLVKSSYRSHIV
jgi:tetratricopeptide (TPR) repeat protein